MRKIVCFLEKIIRTLLFNLVPLSLLFGYEDEELSRLWASIRDLNHPTVEEYQRVENYLHTGKRPYLDLLKETASYVDDNTKRRLQNVLNFKLLGPNEETPIFAVHHLHPRESTKNRCILLYGSYNGIYPQKIERVLEELKRCHYSGDVLVRIGGFPNIENGGLKLCHVPYSFKVTFIQEAYLRGYREILWIDTCMHPIRNLEEIFVNMQKKGYFFTTAGKLRNNLANHLLQTAQYLGVSLPLYHQIDHICSGVIGFHMEHTLARKLLDEWMMETERVYPNITWFPEELSLSIIAWKYNCPPLSGLEVLVCGQQEITKLCATHPTLQFYCDDIR